MNRNCYIYIFAAMLLAISCVKDDDTAALDTGTQLQDTIPAYTNVPISISATITGDTFADGDALIVSNSEILTEPATLAISDGIGKSTATFAGELKVKNGTALSSGVTTFAAALTDAQKSLPGDGLMTKVKEVTSVEEGFDKYGCHACKNFVYNTDANSITLAQTTAIVKFQLEFTGAKVIFTTADKKVYRKYLKGNEMFAVPDGTLVESQVLDVSQTMTAQNDRQSVCTISRSLPYDCLPGVFSVAGNRQVFFSKGNLLYKPYNDTWSFAPYQYFDCFAGGGDGRNNGNVGENYSEWCGENDWIDHFGCGMWLVGGTPVKTNQNSMEYIPAYDETYTRFTTPPAIGDQWRTLSIGEWSYLAGCDKNKRSNADSLRYMANVCGVLGIVILPDMSSVTVAESYDAEQWLAAESAGAMFLPAAGYRVNTALYYVGDYGIYWSESADPTGLQNGFYFGYPTDGLMSSNNIVSLYPYDRWGGACVRLVRDGENFTKN